MKVEVETKIILLEGEEKGRIFTDKKVMNTETEVSEMGIVERLTLAWSYIHNTHDETKAQ